MKKYDYAQDYRDALERLVKLKAEHEAALDAVIDGLGIRAAYPDETKKVDVPHCGANGFLHPDTEYWVTSYGRHRFLEDCKLAAAAVRGTDASIRLSAALSEARSF